MKFAEARLLSIATFPHGSEQLHADREFRVALGHALRDVAGRSDQNSDGAQTSSEPPSASLEAFFKPQRRDTLRKQSLFSRKWRSNVCMLSPCHRHSLAIPNTFDIHFRTFGTPVTSAERDA